MPDADVSAATYGDGISAERCVTCGQTVRLKDGTQTVAIRLSDVEEIACLLYDIDDQDAWGATITRLERASGRTIKQMLFPKPDGPAPDADDWPPVSPV